MKGRRVEYRITAEERIPNSGEDRTPRYQFNITGGRNETVCSIHALGSLKACGSLSEIDWEEVLSMVAIDQIERTLLADALDWSINPYRWEVSDEETILNVDRVSKLCDMRLPAKPRGFLCAATETGDPEPTTLPLCMTCDMPDARLVCSGLVHPVTTLSKADADTLSLSGNSATAADNVGFKRSVTRAFCEAHPESQDWKKCRPWLRGCWYRIVDTSEAAPSPDSAAPRRIVDEVGYLRLVYADRFRVKASEFWPNRDPSAYAVLLDDSCTSPRQFAHNIVVLDDVLSAMNPHEQLAEDRRKNGSRVNGITAMGRVLEDCIDGTDCSYVKPLQALKTVRNSFSHQPGAKLLEALGTLGVQSYPPHDWQIVCGKSPHPWLRRSHRFDGYSRQLMSTIHRKVRRGDFPLAFSCRR